MSKISNDANINFIALFLPIFLCELGGGGGGRGAVAQSVEHSTPGEEVPGSIPAVAARSL